MKKKNLILTGLACTFLTVGNIMAQDYPPNADPGKCYAKCMIPDEYQTVSTLQEVKPASQRVEIVPAQYETVSEQVVVKPASKRLEVIPGKYETRTRQYESKAASSRLVEVPASYETKTEQIEVAPATTKWVKRRGDSNCLSANPDDCLVWCLVEVPAQYQTITKTVLKTAATTQEVPIPAEYGTVSETVETQPATTREIEIPAEYRTVTKTVVKVPAQTRTIDIPAEYRDFTTRKLVRQGGMSEWREVLCGDKVDGYTIRQIQDALKARGYDPGPVDNVFGAQTKAALIQFQKDKGLPVGQLDYQTLKSLGIER